MKWRPLLCFVFALLILSGLSTFSYGQDAAAKPVKPQFFAGQVVEADAEHVKVSRTLLGRAPESRVFVLDGKTKTPKGGVKPKSRVTVRYEHLPEHDLALEIEVRPTNRAPKAS